MADMSNVNEIINSYRFNYVFLEQLNKIKEINSIEDLKHYYSYLCKLYSDFTIRLFKYNDVENRKVIFLSIFEDTPHYIEFRFSPKGDLMDLVAIKGRAKIKLKINNRTNQLDKDLTQVVKLPNHYKYIEDKLLTTFRAINKNQMMLYRGMYFKYLMPFDEYKENHIIEYKNNDVDLYVKDLNEVYKRFFGLELKNGIYEVFDTLKSDLDKQGLSKGVLFYIRGYEVKILK